MATSAITGDGRERIEYVGRIIRTTETKSYKECSDEMLKALRCLAYGVKPNSSHNQAVS